MLLNTCRRTKCPVLEHSSANMIVLEQAHAAENSQQETKRNTSHNYNETHFTIERRIWTIVTTGYKPAI